MDIFEWLREFNIYTVVIRMVFAFILGGIVGFERQKNGHAAGLRTHILVCLGATLTTLTGLFITEALHYGSDPMRIGAQVVSGIGFIGAGTIMVTRGTHIRGLTTAAGLWATAAIGLSLGAGFYEGALICTLLISIVVVLLKKLDHALSGKSHYFEIYIEISGTENVNYVLEKLESDELDINDIEITSPRSNKAGNVGVNLDTYSENKTKDNEHELMMRIRSIENVDIVIIG